MDPTINIGLLKYFSKRVFDLAEKNISAQKEPIDSTILDSIIQHQTFIQSWSENSKIFGMPTEIDVSKNTIPFRLDLTPNRFKSSEKSNLIPELNILNDDFNYVISAPVGSGKTTLLKRIANYIQTQQTSTDRNIDRFDFSIVILLRKIELQNIIDEILSILFSKENKFIGEINIHNKLFLLEKITREFNILFLFDGLDEIQFDNRKNFVEQIEKICEITKTKVSKVIITSRAGFLAKYNIKRTNEIQIAPFLPKEIRKIALKWLGSSKASKFISALRKTEYQDLGNRPLSLLQLIIFFKSENYLPKRISFVYDKIVRIVLRDWDESRDVTRTTAYTNFDVESKVSFLSDLAYQLLIKKELTEFSSKHLQDIYIQHLYAKYSLPKDEVENIMSEVESHTGLIEKISRKKYSFTHLSIQEYFCANHIANIDNFKEIHEEFFKNNEIISVAISIADDPNRIFYKLILNDYSWKKIELGLASFIARLETERPRLYQTELFAFCLIKIMFSLCEDYDLSTYKSFQKIIQDNEMEEIIRFVLDQYFVPYKTPKALGNYRIKPGIKLGNYSLPIEGYFVEEFLKS